MDVRRKGRSRSHPLPAVHELISQALGDPLLRGLDPRVVKILAREYVAQSRANTAKHPTAETRTRLLQEFPGYVKQRLQPAYLPVINATGVLLHTNLGRAPLPPAIWSRVKAMACGYSTLEYDLERGTRGERGSHLARKLGLLLECEDVVVVNNNAAAVLLILSTFARDREVLVSRGELIEIGGQFRLPEVFAQSGARLVEVGTTNRTRLLDYIHHASEATAGVLRVHPSNYRIVGFVERPSLRELAAWTRERGLYLWKDLGSGLLETAGLGAFLPDEPTVQQALKAGCDLVCFSGDKILGGPQAGIIAGTHELCCLLRRNPLYRALRVDKLTLALLDGLVDLYLHPASRKRIPVLRLMSQDRDRLQTRGRQLLRYVQRRLRGNLRVALEPDRAVIGGGLAPTVEIPSWCLAFTGADHTRLEALLRRGHPPILGRVENDRLLLNLHTVFPGQWKSLREALATALRRLAQERR